MSDTQHEKTPLASKKFVAYLVAMLTWKILLVIYVLVFNGEMLKSGGWVWGTAITIVICTAFVEVGYILGQSGLDLFVRGGGIAAEALSKIFGKSKSTDSGPTDNVE